MKAAMSDEWTVNPLRKFLWKLSNDLKSEDVEGLTYLAELGDAVAEGCKKGIHVFKELQRLARIKPDNLECLKELMRDIDRHDLVARIGNY